MMENAPSGSWDKNLPLRVILSRYIPGDFFSSFYHLSLVKALQVASGSLKEDALTERIGRTI